jgi:alpha-tubulin suppressor-like RCC1 family protein
MTTSPTMHVATSALVVIAALSACSQTTQIVLVIDSDIVVPAPLAQIDIEVASARTEPTYYEVALGDSRAPSLPLTLSLYPTDGTTDTDVVVGVRAVDTTGGTLMARDVRTRFVPGASRMLRVLLADRCVGVVCDAGETCDESGCRGIAIPGDELPAWTGTAPALAGGEACVPEEESCNAWDDDCDTVIDEGIDRLSDNDHCGRCGHACDGGACEDGFCPGEAPVAISAGGAHSCVRREGGAVACWGQNIAAQAGAGAPYSRTIPVDVAGIDGASSVSAGGAHTCFVSGGAVRCFGNGSEGQLGTETAVDSPVPVGPTTLTTVTQVSAGIAHTCAIDGAGAAWCWGRNSDGQVGDGTTAQRNVPVMIAGSTGVTAIAAGFRNSCAVVGAGAVWCWGANDVGQLGRGVVDPMPGPVEVMGITDAVAVGVGRRHACALRGDGTVACWGANESSQLGNGTTTASPLPVAVLGIEGATALAVAIGGTHACVAHGDGRVSCWGSNLAGQLGDGSMATRAMPVEVMVIRDAVQVAAGGHNDDGTGHSCALAANGHGWCWGDGSFYRRGDGTRDRSLVPIALRGLP